MSPVTTSLALSHTIPPTLVILGAAYAVIRRADLSVFDRVILAASTFIVSLSTAIGISFWIFGNLQLLLIFPVCGVLVGILALDIRRKQPIAYKRPQNKAVATTMVAMLMVGVVVLGAGRQFEYKSAWGDIGAYLTAAQHYNRGGAATFRYASRGRLLTNPEKPIPLTGVVNDAQNGLQQFHALPGWPGWMALFGTDRHRAGILPLLFAFSIGAFYLLASRWYGVSLSTFIATLALAVLPLAWFQSLYATAEMLAFSTILASLVLLAISRSGLVALTLGVFAFGVTHISLIVALPLAAAALTLAVTTSIRGKWWAVSAGALAAISGIGAHVFALHVSNAYSTDIIHSLFGSHRWLVWVVTCCPVAASFWGSCLHKSVKLQSLANATLLRAARHAQLIGILVIGILLCAAMAQAYLIGWTDHYFPKAVSIYNSASARTSYVDKGFASLAHLSIANLFLASGGIGLLAFIFLPFSRESNGRTMALWLACMYTVLIYGIAQVDVTNNYYASRYFLPIAVPLLLLVSVPWLSHLGRRALLALFAVPVAAYFVASLLFQGFFIGDSRFLAKINGMIGDSSTVYVSGSTWLSYFIGPSLMLSPRQMEGSNQPYQSGEPSSMLLVTDENMNASDHTGCVSEIERRIPWQIGYLTRPDLDQKSVCVLKRASGPVMIDLGSNHWLVNGEMTFTIQRPTGSPSINVAILSNGWWSMKKPFANLFSLAPKLKVCGHAFKLDEITPKRLTFSGVMNSAFCEAELKTATFVPRDIGEGSDSRELGMDLHGIVVTRALTAASRAR